MMIYTYTTLYVTLGLVLFVCLLFFCFYNILVSTIKILYPFNGVNNEYIRRDLAL